MFAAKSDASKSDSALLNAGIRKSFRPWYGWACRHHTSQQLCSRDQPSSRTKCGSSDGRSFVLVAYGSRILTSNWKPLWRWGCWAERPSPSDDRCLGLGPLLSKCKWKTNGLSYGAPALSARMYRCTYTPRLQGAHAKNTRNHSIPDWRVRAYSVESAEVKGVFYPSVTNSQDYRTAKIKMKETITPLKMIAIFFSLLQRHFFVSRTNSNANVWHITRYLIVKPWPAARNHADY